MAAILSRPQCVKINWHWIVGALESFLQLALEIRSVWKGLIHRHSFTTYRQVSIYKTHFNRQLNCWSLRCSWSCSNHIFILNLTPGFNGLGKDIYKMRREAFKFWDSVRLIIETLRYCEYLWKYAPMPLFHKRQGRNKTGYSHPFQSCSKIRWH